MQIWRNDALWNKLNEKKKFVEFSLEIVEIKTKILKIARAAKKKKYRWVCNHESLYRCFSSFEDGFSALTILTYRGS